jgi:carbonic anhydrase
MASGLTSQSAVSADQALQRLIDGNQRFLLGQAQFPTLCKETLADLARGQQPYATILGCSGSRVPPELIFDANFGELFIVRAAGNIVSAGVMGSLQYAGAHLHAPLFRVLGHEGCDALKETLASKLQDVQHRSRIQTLVNSILPGLADFDATSSNETHLV